MRKLIIIPLFFFSISVFGQFTKNQLYNGINLNIRNKGASQLRLANMLDSIVVSMGSGGGSMVYPGAGIALSTGSAWGASITDNSANWNTAFGWGNHASAGYLIGGVTNVLPASTTQFDLASNLYAFKIFGGAGVTQPASFSAGVGVVELGVGSSSGANGYSAATRGIQIGSNISIKIGGTSSTFIFTDNNTVTKSGMRYAASGYETNDLTLTSRGYVKDGVYTFTNKTFALGSNTFSGTKAQFNTAVTDGDILYVGDVTSNATHTGDVTGSTTLTIASGVIVNADVNASAAIDFTKLSGTSNALSSAITDPVRTVTGTDAIVQADNGRTVYFNSASPFNFTIDALTINTVTMFRNIGAGTVTFVDGSGVTSTGATELLADEVGGVEYIASTTPIISKAGGSGGSGDVVSSETSVSDLGAIAWDGTTGKLIRAISGQPVTTSTGFTSGRIAISNGTGNSLKDDASLTYDGLGGVGATTFNGVALTTAGDGTGVLRDDGTYGNPLVTRKNALVIEADFYTDTSPYSPSFIGAAISGGTDNIIAGEANHPGIIDLRDGTTANGGWNASTAANAFLIAGGEKAVVTFQIRNARATANGWIGFKDNSTNAQPVDGAYVYFIGNGTTVTMDARTRSNSTETINGTTWAPTLNTWYTLVITVNAGGTQVDYEVFNDAGTSQWSVNNVANIPTGAGRQTGFGIQANESTTDAAAAIMYVDYARMEINRVLTR